MDPRLLPLRRTRRRPAANHDAPLLAPTARFAAGPDDGVGEPSFDALVLYSVKDDALVKDYILNRLEDHGDGRRSPYQLCLQHRESCNLDTATAASRSVVIL